MSNIMRRREVPAPSDAEIANADRRRKRPALPRRRRRAHGAADARALATHLHVGRSGRAGRHAGACASAWRGPRRVSRFRRPARRRRRALPASARVARARPQRGIRPALPLSRLEDRRRRQRRRDAVGAAGKLPRGESEAHGLPVPRKRAASCGSGWAADAAPPFEPPGVGARRPTTTHQHRQDARRRQLGAGARGRDRLGAQLDAACDRHAACARRRRARDGDRLAATVDGQGAAARRATDRFRLPLRGDHAGRSRTPPPATTYASRCSWRRSPC